MNCITKRKILFVDDESPWRDRVSVSLARAGFDILAVPDASEAMREAEDPALRLIIVDKDLAGESGVMLTRFLRWNHPDVSAMIYANAEQEPDTASHPSGQTADRCLRKGSMEELIAHVGYYIQ